MITKGLCLLIKTKIMTQHFKNHKNKNHIIGYENYSGKNASFNV